MLPGGVAGLVNRVSHRCNTRGARSNFSVGCLNGRSIKNIAPGIWNSISMGLKQWPSVSCFKERSKMDLLAPCSALVCSVPHCCSCAVSVWVSVCFSRCPLALFSSFFFFIPTLSLCGLLFVLEFYCLVYGPDGPVAFIYRSLIWPA